MSTARKTYTPESLNRALAHHLGRGALTSLHLPNGERPARWRISVPDDTRQFTLTEAQVWGLCLGLRASEIIAERERGQ
jgi:hypothetical protein